MTSEDIIRMAREAGFRDTTTTVVALGVSWEQVQRFAALVAAAERDRMCQQFNIPKELAHEKATGNEAD